MHPVAIDLPIIGPPKKTILNANDRLHWRPKSERTKYWRERAKLEALNAMRDGRLIPAERALIVAWFVWPDLRRRDPVNYEPTIKACVDGIVDAGWLPDDGFRNLEGPDFRRWPEKGPWTIRLELTVIERRAA